MKKQYTIKLNKNRFQLPQSSIIYNNSLPNHDLNYQPLHKNSKIQSHPLNQSDLYQLSLVARVLEKILINQPTTSLSIDRISNVNIKYGLNSIYQLIKKYQQKINNLQADLDEVNDTKSQMDTIFNILDLIIQNQFDNAFLLLSKKGLQNSILKMLVIFLNQRYILKNILLQKVKKQVRVKNITQQGAEMIRIALQRNEDLVELFNLSKGLKLVFSQVKNYKLVLNLDHLDLIFDIELREILSKLQQLLAQKILIIEKNATFVQDLTYQVEKQIDYFHHYSTEKSLGNQIFGRDNPNQNIKSLLSKLFNLTKKQRQELSNKLKDQESARLILQLQNISLKSKFQCIQSRFEAIEANRITLQFQQNKIVEQHSHLELLSHKLEVVKQQLQNKERCLSQNNLKIKESQNICSQLKKKLEDFIKQKGEYQEKSYLKSVISQLNQKNIKLVEDYEILLKKYQASQKISHDLMESIYLTNEQNTKLRNQLQQVQSAKLFYQKRYQSLMDDAVSKQEDVKFNQIVTSMYGVIFDLKVENQASSSIYNTPEKQEIYEQSVNQKNDEFHETKKKLFVSQKKIISQQNQLNKLNIYKNQLILKIDSSELKNQKLQKEKLQLQMQIDNIRNAQYFRSKNLKKYKLLQRLRQIFLCLKRLRQQSQKLKGDVEDNKKIIIIETKQFLNELENNKIKTRQILQNNFLSLQDIQFQQLNIKKSNNLFSSHRKKQIQTERISISTPLLNQSQSRAYLQNNKNNQSSSAKKGEGINKLSNLCSSIEYFEENDRSDYTGDLERSEVQKRQIYQIQNSLLGIDENPQQICDFEEKFSSVRNQSNIISHIFKEFCVRNANVDQPIQSKFLELISEFEYNKYEQFKDRILKNNKKKILKSDSDRSFNSEIKKTETSDSIILLQIKISKLEEERQNLISKIIQKQKQIENLKDSLSFHADSISNILEQKYEYSEKLELTQKMNLEKYKEYQQFYYENLHKISQDYQQKFKKLKQQYYQKEVSLKNAQVENHRIYNQFLIVSQSNTTFRHDLEIIKQNMKNLTLENQELKEQNDRLIEEIRKIEEFIDNIKQLSNQQIQRYRSKSEKYDHIAQDYERLLTQEHKRKQILYEIQIKSNDYEENLRLFRN